MVGDTSKKKLVGRHKRVAFMDVAGDGKTYTRMTGFTSLSDGKNSTEYSRQYVDEASERSDVVGYAPSMDYEFDLYTNDAVQKKLARGRRQHGNSSHEKKRDRDEPAVRCELYVRCQQGTGVLD